VLFELAFERVWKHEIIFKNLFDSFSIASAQTGGIRLFKI
jgi:hypothetical protein